MHCVVVVQEENSFHFSDKELLLIQQGLRALERCSERGDFGFFSLSDEEKRLIRELGNRIDLSWLRQDC